MTALRHRDALAERFPTIGAPFPGEPREHSPYGALRFRATFTAVRSHPRTDSRGSSSSDVNFR